MLIVLSEHTKKDCRIPLRFSQLNIGFGERLALLETNMKLNTAVMLALGSLLLGLPITAHEGHDKAFVKNDSIVSTTQRITVPPEGQASMSIESQPVKLGSVNQVLKVTGNVQAAENRSFDINPTVSGVVKSVFAKQGDLVSNGQVVATVYSAEIAAILTKLLEDRAKTLADIARLRVQYQRDIAVQSKAVVHSLSDLKREELLLNEGITARKNYVDAQLAYETDLVKLDTLKKQSVQDTELLQKQLATMTEAVKSQLKVMGLLVASAEKSISSNHVLSEVPIISPVDGIVIFRDITNGETLSAGKKIFSIVNLSPMWITFDIFQEQMPLIKIGQPVQIRTSTGKVLEGRISSIGTMVDPDSRTIHVRVVTENRSGELKPQMFVTAEITVGHGNKNQQIVVPTSALNEENGRTWVYVQYGNEFQPVSVKLGSRTSEAVEILDGLFEGDRIVVHGGKQLRAQSMLTANGSKETEGEHKHEEIDNKQNSTGQFSIQLILIGVVAGIVLTVLGAAVMNFSNKKNEGKKP